MLRAILERLGDFRHLMAQHAELSGVRRMRQLDVISKGGSNALFK
jgi:hypothetical protein